MFKHFTQEIIHLYKNILDREVTLVPVPRSHPIAPGNLWPARVIAETICDMGFGKQVIPILERHTAIRSASGSSSSNERPLIHEHIASLKINHQIIDTDNITIVDDIITQGRTSCACYELIQKAYPGKIIHIFAMMKTMSNFDGSIKELLIDPTIGTITRYPSGKSFRD